jgi:hypothetical protein
MNAQTFASLPEHIDRELKRRAVEEKKDVSAVIVETLERGLGLNRQEHSDLDFLVGSWETDPGFDEAVKAFETIDEDQWR